MTYVSSEFADGFDGRILKKHPLLPPNELFTAFQKVCVEAYFLELCSTLKAYDDASKIVDVRLPSIAAPKEADFSIQKDGYKKWVPVDKADYENALAVRETRWTERAKAWEDLLPKDLPSPSNTILNYFTFVQRASFFTTGEPLDLRTEESIHKFIVERFFAFSGRDIESELADIDFQPFLMESIAFHGAPFFDEDGGPDSSYVPDSELPGPDFRPPVKDDSVDDDPYE